MFNATINSPQIYTDDPSQLQCFVDFDDGNGNTFTKSYTYSVGDSQALIDQVNADVTNFNAADTAISMASTDIQTALTATPNSAISLAGGVIANPVDPVQPAPITSKSSLSS